MGGKNAVIVMPDADLDKAAAAIHGGAFGSTGQRCTATSRVIAHPDIKERAGRSAGRRGGEDQGRPGPRRRRSTWARRSTTSSGQTVLDYIEVGKSEGARLLTGGTRPRCSSRRASSSSRPSSTACRPAMRIFKEEIFGPVLVGGHGLVARGGAAKFANGVEYGLTTSIFTQDITSVMRFVEDVETGMVHVNEPTVGGEAQLPFGGTKSTGVGEREMAEEGLQLLHRDEDRVHQLLGQGRTVAHPVADFDGVSGPRTCHLEVARRTQRFRRRSRRPATAIIAQLQLIRRQVVSILARRSSQLSYGERKVESRALGMKRLPNVVGCRSVRRLKGEFMTLQRWCVTALVAILVTGLAMPALAQEQTGNITGRAMDTSGGALPGVTVSITSPNLIGGARTAVTDEQGVYRFTLLPGGIYTVKFDLTGFTHAEHRRRQRSAPARR